MAKDKTRVDKHTPAADQSRRNFLKGAGTGALMLGGASVVPTASASSDNTCKTPGCDYDVVVIGGGFAGVTAARDSMENGYKTLLLEARNRLGGRTFYSQFEGHSVELGGTWIHHSQPFVWAEKERYGLEVKETPGMVPDTMLAHINGKLTTLGEAEIMALFEAFQKYIAEARQILVRPYDILFNQGAALKADKISAREHLKTLNLTPLQYDLMDGVIAAMAHNRSTQMSYLEALRWLILPGGGFEVFLDAVGRFKFKDGTISLINKMLDDAKPEVRLSTPVKAIEDLGDRVRITPMRGDSLIAASVIVTVPMNVLPNIQFTPALDSKLVEAAQEKHTGAGFKVYIKVKGKLGKVLSFANSDAPMNMLFTYSEAEDHTILCGFGADIEQLDVYDDEAVQAMVASYFPGAQVESSFSYDWQLDPYAQGTYCSYKPGWLEKYFAHFQQDQGRILFGSGDHGEGWRGFIDGAIGEGAKAAQRAKAVLG